MSFKFFRHTTETYHNSYELTIDEKFCKELSHYFIDVNVTIIRPLTPELVHYYMTQASKLDEWEKLSEEEQNFADRVMDYCDNAIYNGDMWTFKSDIVSYIDEWGEV